MPISAGRGFVVAALVLGGLVACTELGAPRPDWRPPASRPGRAELVDRGEVDRAVEVERRALVRALIEDGEHDADFAVLTAAERAELQALYQPNGCAPLWLESAGHLTSDAREGVELLRHAADEGLDPTDYFEGLIGRLAPLTESASLAPRDVARFDLSVSAGLLRYLRHLHMGRVDPRAIGFRLDAPSDRHDFPALLCSAIADDRLTELVVELQPPIGQYHELRTALRRYRLLANASTPLAPPPIVIPIHPGESSRVLPELQRALVAMGDLQAGDPLTVGRYEGALADAVQRFQTRHGLDPDGVIGKETVAALGVPLSWRVRQIELALERLRWLPHVGPERLIVLNIPMFRLWAWDSLSPSEAPRFSMDAIVGRALHTQTPVFVAHMREVIVRPYWNVPRSILRNEVLPRLERDPDYLGRENMEIVRGQGDLVPRVALTAESLVQLRQGALRVRQRPGPKNALGLVKFVFPNKEDVYMHGTPAQALFAKRRRDFSHGCVRVADPVALTEWVLQDQPQWTRARILRSMSGTQTIHVPLLEPIQVILFYTTAAVMPEGGEVRFAEDIYGHDARLDRALQVRRAHTITTRHF